MIRPLSSEPPKDHKRPPTDSAIEDIRNKILHALRPILIQPKQGEHWFLTLDFLLAEYTDSIIDREETRWKATVANARESGRVEVLNAKRAATGE